MKTLQIILNLTKSTYHKEQFKYYETLERVGGTRDSVTKYYKEGGRGSASESYNIFSKGVLNCLKKVSRIIWMASWYSNVSKKKFAYLC